VDFPRRSITIADPRPSSLLIRYILIELRSIRPARLRTSSVCFQTGAKNSPVVCEPKVLPIFGIPLFLGPLCP
jgi:hypothetical protein